MGIHKLMELLTKKAPKCIKQIDIKALNGKILACDASLVMYQFLVQTQSVYSNKYVKLTDKQGTQTGHLLGLLNRTVLMLENGIKPIWVFDGIHPIEKERELEKRKKNKEIAQKKAENALETGNIEELLKQSQRSIHLTSEMKEDAKLMLKYFGIPVIQAPCEAEAQCAELTKQQIAYGSVTEDMDALTFQSQKLVRNLKATKQSIIEVDYKIMLQELNLTYNQFVDLCILCGCDYTENIEGIGPLTALKLINQYQNIESIIANLNLRNKQTDNKAKFKLPSSFDFAQTRNLFIHPKIDHYTVDQFKWDQPDKDSLMKHLAEKKGFSKQRILTALHRMEPSANNFRHFEEIKNKKHTVNDNIEDQQRSQNEKPKQGKGKQKLEKKMKSQYKKIKIVQK